jgi:hypothetical protein
MRGRVERTIPVSTLNNSEDKLNTIELAYFNVETTPPLRIVSLCSVNVTSFARGYSRSSFGRNTLAGRGVKKKLRPVGVYRYSVDVYSVLTIERTYHT